MALVIETDGLRKEFRTRRKCRVAVDSLDLAVSAGGVHGFLGPNGSGKTTTIRMLLGLVRPTRGVIRLFGLPVPAALPRVVGRVGAVVESPRFSPSNSGHQGLTLLAKSIDAPALRVDATLETVGLAERSSDRYKSYSLGMRQRLAVAAALLKSAELLILDEPTNGLDPAGIREVRELIASLSGQGVTVLLSSHLLAEVQQVCSSVTIIGNGKTLASGEVAGLLAGATTSYRVGTTDPRAAEGALRDRGLTVSRSLDNGEYLLVEASKPQDLIQVLASVEVGLTELTPVGRDLESLFLELTAHDELGRTEHLT